MSNKINDQIADMAIDTVERLINEGKISEDQREAYEKKIFEELMEEENI